LAASFPWWRKSENLRRWRGTRSDSGKDDPVDFWGFPPYEERSGKSAAQGIGDYPFLLIKNRFVSANEENGNYVLTGFLAFS
jgi:hypothetical protein